MWLEEKAFKFAFTLKKHLEENCFFLSSVGFEPLFTLIYYSLFYLSNLIIPFQNSSKIKIVDFHSLGAYVYQLMYKVHN